MPAHIISIVNQKGGCGKTTIAMNLAGTLVERHQKKVLVIDGDPQSSATIWAGYADDNKPFPCTVVSLADAEDKAHRQIKNFVDDYDIIIIDCPPSTNAGLNGSALLVSDLAIVPVKPSSTDLWAMKGILNLIDSVKVTNEDLVTKIALNMCSPNSKLSKTIVDFCKNDENIELIETFINNRTIYGEMALRGGIVYDSNNSQAKIEFALFTDEILNIINNLN